MGTVAVSRETVSKNAITLANLEVGSTTMINGFTICREAERSFHLRVADEAIFGSARNVAEWMELINKKL